ncbi:MAG TPA: LON peptidase substrate-binding domain-containing protein [Myxococcaceae bacterium]
MTPLDSVRAACRALKVFPLPQAVLFPGTAIPLHIFEPRYRALVRDCLAGDQVMALVQLQPGWVEDAQARPPMQPVACAGLVVAHEALEDGKFNIVLQGLVRVQILAELPPEKLYREVLAEVVEDGPYEGPGEEMLRQAVLEVCHRLPTEAAEGLVQLAAQNGGGALADVLGAALVMEPERRQRILEERSIDRRLQLVLGEVGALMAKLIPPNPTMPS